MFSPAGQQVDLLEDEPLDAQKRKKLLVMLHIINRKIAKGFNLVDRWYMQSKKTISRLDHYSESQLNFPYTCLH